jgi:hypothetical protein
MLECQKFVHFRAAQRRFIEPILEKTASFSSRRPWPGKLPCANLKMKTEDFTKTVE